MRFYSAQNDGPNISRKGKGRGFERLAIRYGEAGYLQSVYIDSAKLPKSMIRTRLPWLPRYTLEGREEPRCSQPYA